MPIASVERLKRFILTQLHETTAEDEPLRWFLDVAEEVVEIETGKTFAAATTGTSDPIYLDHPAVHLPLPADYVAGSVTAVTAPSGYTVPTYVERDRYLVAADADGILYSWPMTNGLAALNGYDYGYAGGIWQPRVPYVVAGDFGYGVATPAVVEVCMEIAVMVRKYAAAGGSDVVGTETAAVTVRSQLNPLQKAILAAHAADSGDVGVW